MSAHSDEESTHGDEKCPLCCHRPLNTHPVKSQYGVRLCTTCKTFIKRSEEKNHLDPENFIRMTCSGKGDYNCPLNKDNPCTKCRLAKFARLKIEADLDPAGDVFTAINQFARQEIHDRPGKEIFKKWLHSRIAEREVQPILEKLLRYDPDYVRKTPHIYWKNFIVGKIEVPSDENQFWELVRWCMRELVEAKILFISNIIGELDIEFSDQCQIIESSHVLMFYAETGLPHRQNVVTSFSMIFRRMLKKWPDCFDIMDVTSNMITAIHSIHPVPNTTEWSFISALIVTSSVDATVCSAVTMEKLSGLANRLWKSFESFLSVEAIDDRERNSNERIAAFRHVIDCVNPVRTVRTLALRKLVTKNPELAWDNTKPVAESIQYNLKSTWSVESIQNTLIDKLK